MRRPSPALFLLMLLPAACANPKHAVADSASQWRLQGAFPGAYLHLPPMPSATPASEPESLPVQVDAVARRGALIKVTWDAPDAISATILFAPSGADFHPVLTTREPDATFRPPSAHGVVRIAVTDGRHWAYADARI